MAIEPNSPQTMYTVKRMTEVLNAAFESNFEDYSGTHDLALDLWRASHELRPIKSSGSLHVITLPLPRKAN